MLVDLIILTIIGVITEFLGTKMSGLVLGAAPTFTFSFLVVFVAVMRWNLWGLLIVPFMAGATLLGGSMNSLPYYAAMYDWRVFIATCVSLAVIGINVIFFKKFGTKRVMLNMFAVIGLVFLNYILCNEIFKMTHRLLCTGNPFVSGDLPFTGRFYDEATNEMVSEVVDLCEYIERVSIYNIFGLVVAYVGIFVLRSQGVVNNVVDKLIEDKRIRDEIMAAEHFEVPESISDTDSNGPEIDNTNDGQKN